MTKRPSYLISSLLISVSLLLFPLQAHALYDSSEFDVPTPSAQVFGVTTGPDGAIWFTEATANKIGRITTSGNFTEYDVPTPESYPSRIAAGPDGALWFNEPNTNKIGRVTTAGDITEFSLPSPGDNYPFDIVSGPDGAIWFTEGHSNRIGRITVTGTITEYPLTVPNAGPIGMTVGPDGALWFTQNAGNIGIGRITTSGDITNYPIPTAGGYVYRIVSGPDGALWFTEANANKIGRITTSGGVTEYSIPGGASIGAYDITSGPDGAMWFAEANTNRIGRITTSGVFSEYDVPTANGVPLGVTAGPDGAIWFTEVGANKIGRLSVVQADTQPPVLSNPSFGVNPKAVGQSSDALSVTVSDDVSGVANVEYYDPVLATWQPMTVNGNVATANIVTQEASYPAGMYNFQVRATDNAGNTSLPVGLRLDIYNPAGGYAAGHGFITPGGPTSESGDSLPAQNGPNVKATFDFTVKYSDATATVPSGSSTFTWGSNCNRPNSDCFSATVTSLSWLIIPTSGYTATFQGLATLTQGSSGLGSNYHTRISTFAGGPTNVASHYLLQIFAEGANPDVASPIYQASGDLTGGQVTLHQ